MFECTSSGDSGLQAARYLASCGCYEKGSGDFFSWAVTHFDENLDLVKVDTLRKLGHLLQLDLPARNIRQMARIDIVEVVMRFRI